MSGFGETALRLGPWKLAGNGLGVMSSHHHQLLPVLVSPGVAAWVGKVNILGAKNSLFLRSPYTVKERGHTHHEVKMSRRKTAKNDSWFNFMYRAVNEPLPGVILKTT